MDEARRSGLLPLYILLAFCRKHPSTLLTQEA